jgi:ribosome-binding protein aMBF1 (putative translation factor)
MIKNKKQLTVTKAQLGLLSESLQKLTSGRQTAATMLQRSSLEADVSRLKQEVAEYEQARAGNVDLGVIRGIQQLGKALVQARIAARLTQDDLAQQLGSKPQQIQRYESSEYSSASVATVMKVANVLARRMASLGGRAKAG